MEIFVTKGIVWVKKKVMDSPKGKTIGNAYVSMLETWEGGNWVRKC